MKNSLFYFLFVFILLSLGSHSLYAQKKLDDYLQRANELNPAFQNFVFQKQIADLEIQKIKTQFEEPQWSLTGDYLLAPFLFNNKQVIALTPTPDAKAFGYDAGVTNGGLYSAQVNVNYPLFSKKQNAPLVEQQTLSQMGLVNQQQLLKVDLKRKITSDYLAAYLIQQQMDYVKQVQNQLIDQKEFVRKLADRGLMRITDLQLLNLEISNQTYQLNNLQTQFQLAIQTLNTDAGIVDTTSVRLAAVQIEAINGNVKSLFLEQYRLDSLAAVNEQAMMETRYLPQVNAFANSGINAVELNNIYRKFGVSAGVHVAWLFGDGGQKELNQQQNELKKIMASNQAIFAKNQIQNNRLNYEMLINQYRENIQLLNKQLKNYETLFDSFKQEIALGQLSIIDYLNVLKTYASLQQQKVELETQLLMIINELNYWNN